MNCFEKLEVIKSDMLRFLVHKTAGIAEINPGAAGTF